MIFEVFKREILRIKKRKDILVALLVLPILFSFMICEVFKVGTPKDLPIAVFDGDNSQISRKLIRMVNSTPACEVKTDVINIEEGKEKILNGEVYALIVIPKDFSRDIYRLKRPSVVFYYNNQMILTSGAISKDVNLAVQTLITELDAGLRIKKGTSFEIAKKQVNLVSVDEHIKSNPYLNYAYFLSLGAFCHIFQILVLALSVWALGSEFKEGSTKKWLECANNSILIAVFGKLLPYFIIFFVELILTYLLYFVIYGAHFNGNTLFVILGGILFILACQSMAIVIVGITSNLRLSLSCAAFYTAMGFAFAGVTFPIVAMPFVARLISVILPLRHYSDILINEVLRGVSFNYSIFSFLSLFAFICLGLIFIPRLKKVASDEARWYRL